jgi:hypothetical protein
VHCRTVGRDGPTFFSASCKSLVLANASNHQDAPMLKEWWMHWLRAGIKGGCFCSSRAATYISLCVAHVEDGVKAGATFSICVEDGSRAIVPEMRVLRQVPYEDKGKERSRARCVCVPSPWRGFVRFYGGGP